MKGKKERGALIVEASIVFPVTFLVIFFLIYAGNAYLQKSKVEKIVNECALDGAAYCADPMLSQVESGSVPDVGSLNVYPYRFFSAGSVGNIEGEMESLIADRVSKMSTGLFSGMKPKNLTTNAKFHNGFIYATFTVDVSYRVEIPIRLLGMKDFLSMRVETHVSVPVSNSAELMRNVDTVDDYMQRYGVDKKIAAAKEKIREMAEAAKKWFTSS